MKLWFVANSAPADDSSELDQLFQSGLKRELAQGRPAGSFQQLRARILEVNPPYRPVRGGGPGGSHVSGFSLLFYVLNSSPRSAWNTVPC